jgi:hypothetical protein
LSTIHPIVYNPRPCPTGAQCTARSTWTGLASSSDGSIRAIATTTQGDKLAVIGREVKAEDLL